MRAAFLLIACSLPLAACGNAADAPAAGSAQVRLAAEQARRLHGVCTAGSTYGRLKELAFDQAARIRGEDVRLLDRAAAGARASLAEPVSAAGDPGGGVVVCSGRLTLELPADTSGAEPRSLSAQIEFAAQAAPDGSGLVFEVEGAEAIVRELALIGGAPMRGEVPTPPAAPDAPFDGAHRAQHSTGPSFDCGRSRFPSETMICSSRPLSSLDREMASLYYDRMARSGERTRQLLRRTRDAFLVRRDRCDQAGCIASVYEDRIAEIRRIAATS